MKKHLPRFGALSAILLGAVAVSGCSSTDYHHARSQSVMGHPPGPYYVGTDPPYLNGTSFVRRNSIKFLKESPYD